MKKLLIAFVAVAVLLSAASCKKVLAPSAVKGEECANYVTVTGTVTFKFDSADMPAGYATVEITKGTGENAKKFTATADMYGRYTKVIPLTINEDSAAVVAKGIYSNTMGYYEGTQNGNGDKKTVIEVNVKCSKQ